MSPADFCHQTMANPNPVSVGVANPSICFTEELAPVETITLMPKTIPTNRRKAAARR